MNGGGGVGDADYGDITVSGGGAVWNVDFSTTDSVGSTGNASGLEEGTGGIALLQGCDEGQILKWDENVDDQWEYQNDDNSGGATAWDAITNPVAGADIGMTNTAQTMTWSTIPPLQTGFIAAGQYYHDYRYPS